MTTTEKILFICLSALGIFFFIIQVHLLTTSVHIDENMYISAAHLLKSGWKMYSEFDFIQMPNLPILYSIIFSLLNPESPFLAVKTVTLFFFLGSLLISWKILENFEINIIHKIAIILVVFGSSPAIFIHTHGSNYAMPVFFTLLAFYFFQTGHSTQSSTRYILSGLGLSLAIGAKLYYATLWLPFGICLLANIVYFEHNIKKTLIPFMFGSIIGMAPSLYYLITCFTEFIFNNFRYHRLSPYIHAPEMIGYGQGLLNKLQTIASRLGKTDMLSLCLLFLASVSGYIYSGSRKHIISFPTFLLAPVALASLIIPAPPHFEYFAYPVLLMILPLAAFSSTFQHNWKWRMSFSVILITLVIIQGSSFMHLVTKITTNGLFKSEQLDHFEKTTITLKQLKDQLQITGKIATAGPMYAIEAGMPVYRHLSIGHFILILNDHYTHDEQRNHFSSKEALFQVFDKEPPELFLLGIKGRGEKIFHEYIKARSYVPFNDRIFIHPDVYSRAR
jgi:hypothetical protein